MRAASIIALLLFTCISLAIAPETEVTIRAPFWVDRPISSEFDGILDTSTPEFRFDPHVADAPGFDVSLADHRQMYIDAQPWVERAIRTARQNRIDFPPDFDPSDISASMRILIADAKRAWSDGDVDATTDRLIAVLDLCRHLALSGDDVAVILAGFSEYRCELIQLFAEENGPMNARNAQKLIDAIDRAERDIEPVFVEEAVRTMRLHPAPEFREIPPEVFERRAATYATTRKMLRAIVVRGE